MLKFSLSKISECRTGAIGSQFESMNYYLRSEVYAFFNIVLESGIFRHIVYHNKDMYWFCNVFSFVN